MKFTVLSRILRNAWLDLRYGGRFLAGTQKTRFSETGAYDTVNTNSSQLPAMFDDLVKGNDVIVDVGSGKGRLFNWLLSRGYTNKMVGVELDPDVAQSCRYRLRKYTNIQIITGSILDNIPDDGTLFYLYNPFNEKIMRLFIQGLKMSCMKNRRDLTVIYYFCCLKPIFEADSCWTVTDVKANLERPAAIIRLNLDRLEPCG